MGVEVVGYDGRFGEQAVPTHVLGEAGLGGPFVGSRNWYTRVLIMALQGLSCGPSTVWLWSSLRRAATVLQAPRGSRAHCRDKKGEGCPDYP